MNTGRGVENLDRFMRLAECDAMDPRTAYQKTPTSAVFRTLLAPFSRDGAIEHFTLG